MEARTFDRKFDAADKPVVRLPLATGEADRFPASKLSPTVSSANGLMTFGI